jgi:hypothetical protein
VLFFVPSFEPGWSRWWAVVLVLSYVVGALLRAEYLRERGGCLTASVRSEEGEKYRRTWLEIRNCGSVAVRDVDWDLVGEPRGWDLVDEIQRPFQELDVGEKIRVSARPCDRPRCSGDSSASGGRGGTWV